jgi:plastocyanin
MKHLLSAFAVVAALAIPGAALTAGSSPVATTYTVFLGEQKEIPGGFKKFPVTINQFLPSRLVIAAGDSVTFASASFHTVTYSPSPIAPLVPDPAKGSYTGIVDSAGTAFHFDGRPKFIYNGQAFGPFGPKTISGKTPASSGVLSPRSPKAPPATATFSFPKAGTYTLFCTLHVPSMKATVVVKPAGSAVPKTPAQVQADALLAQTAAWDEGKKLHASTKVGPSTVAMGVGGKTTTLAYYPKSLKVKAGTTVNFVNKAPSEIHNLTFGPPKYIEKLGKQVDLLPQGPKSPNQVAPFLVYGSDPAPFTYPGAAAHGNGFYVTPLTAGAGPLPRSQKVTFSTPGTFKFFCWIHGPDMGGTIVVTP